MTIATKSSMTGFRVVVCMTIIRATIAGIASPLSASPSSLTFLYIYWAMTMKAMREVSPVPWVVISDRTHLSPPKKASRPSPLPEPIATGWGGLMSWAKAKLEKSRK